MVGVVDVVVVGDVPVDVPSDCIDELVELSTLSSITSSDGDAFSSGFLSCGLRNNLSAMSMLILPGRTVPLSVTGTAVGDVGDVLIG